MKIRFVVAGAVCLALTGIATAAGPVPPVMNGAPGIAVAGGAHVIAVAKPGGGATQLRLVRDRDGAVLRTRVIPANVGVPTITFSGLVEGTWAKGRRLVLASSVYDDQVNTRFVVIDTRTLAPLRTVRLAGTYAFDAVSGDGAWAYTLYNGGTSHAFVHALNTRTRVARCIDLPWAGEAQSLLDGVRLAVTPNRVLTLTGRGGAVLARIDTRTFSVRA